MAPSKRALRKLKRSPISFVQEAEKAGRIVTEELDQALKECTEEVARISKDCRARNRKFRDTEFDLFNDQFRCLNGVEPPEGETYNPSDVKRVTDIFEYPHFFVDGASSNDMVQGEIGDCWFISALATMSTAEGLVEKFCVARDEKVGVYGFVFFRDARWVTVIIDDLLFISIPKFEELTKGERALYHNDKAKYNKSARKGRKSLYFAISGTEGETWVPLIEKAYAKLHGCYGSLCGGHASEAIEDLTGGISTCTFTDDILDTDQFWHDELLKANQDRLFGVTFRDLDTTRNGAVDVQVNGLVGAHAYSVLRAIEIRGKKFVVVRNPWAESEWNGPWSDGSREWTAEWVQILPQLGHAFGDDGEFVMEYQDFLASWQHIDRTLLFDSQWMMSTQWLRVTPRPLPSAWTFGDVSFTFSMQEASPAILVLSQIDSRYFKAISGRAIWTLEFVVFKKGEKTPFAQSCTTRLYARSVNVEVDLEPGDYVVHVRMDRQYVRPLDYWKPFWDDRSLARLLTERAKSQSIAMNFDSKTQSHHIPIPMNVLAGQDLSELKRKTAKKGLAARVVETWVNGRPDDKRESNDKACQCEVRREDNGIPPEGSEGPSIPEVCEKPSIPEVEETPPSSEVSEPKQNSEEPKDNVDAPQDAPNEHTTEATVGTQTFDLDEAHADNSDTESVADSVVSSVGSVSILNGPPPPMSDPMQPQFVTPRNEDADLIVVGFRIYTKTKTPVEIGGQLREGMELTDDLAL